MRRAASLPDDALRAAYDAHGAELYRFARRSLGDAGLAEDAVQEAFLRAWRASASYDPARASQRTWLFAIVRNVVIDFVRGARRPSTAGDRRRPPTEGAADDELDRALTSWQVETALAELDDDHRRVLVEVHWRGRPYHEVADDLGIPAGTVKSRVYYGLRAMRTHARGPGVARWLSARSRARRGSRRWPAGSWPSSRPTRRRPSSRTSTTCATCRAEADSLLARRRPHARRRRRATGAAAEPPPADLGDRIVARVARERRARRAGRLAVVMSGAAAAVVAAARDDAGPGRAAPSAGEPVAFVREAEGVDASAVVAPEDDGSIIELHVQRARSRHDVLDVAHAARAAATPTGSRPAPSDPTTTARSRCACAARFPPRRWAGRGPPPRTARSPWTPKPG